ncbi:uncharacterized protein LOC62_03G004762 [Vanrija pseudolonga]|uniref:Uncharacterized protein n=1 Tax=Vanrija pseudolonga TaxID=143232 RepID=A0AAF1BI77_9TREE|nr:hypothetical protein LOC62_03G004762 [Vanrija pseudolonga]
MLTSGSWADSLASDTVVLGSHHRHHRAHSRESSPPLIQLEDADRTPAAQSNGLRKPLALDAGAGVTPIDRLRALLRQMDHDARAAKPDELVSIAPAVAPAQLPSNETPLVKAEPRAPRYKPSLSVPIPSASRIPADEDSDYSPPTPPPRPNPYLYSRRASEAAEEDVPRSRSSPPRRVPSRVIALQAAAAAAAVADLSPAPATMPSGSAAPTPRAKPSALETFIASHPTPTAGPSSLARAPEAATPISRSVSPSGKGKEREIYATPAVFEEEPLRRRSRPTPRRSSIDALPDTSAAFAAGLQADAEAELDLVDDDTGVPWAAEDDSLMAATPRKNDASQSYINADAKRSANRFHAAAERSHERSRQSLSSSDLASPRRDGRSGTESPRESPRRAERSATESFRTARARNSSFADTSLPPLPEPESSDSEQESPAVKTRADMFKTTPRSSAHSTPESRRRADHTPSPQASPVKSASPGAVLKSESPRGVLNGESPRAVHRVRSANELRESLKRNGSPFTSPSKSRDATTSFDASVDVSRTSPRSSREASVTDQSFGHDPSLEETTHSFKARTPQPAHHSPQREDSFYTPRERTPLADSQWWPASLQESATVSPLELASLSYSRETSFHGEEQDATVEYDDEAEGFEPEEAAEPVYEDDFSDDDPLPESQVLPAPPVSPPRAAVLPPRAALPEMETPRRPLYVSTLGPREPRSALKKTIRRSPEVGVPRSTPSVRWSLDVTEHFESMAPPVEETTTPPTTPPSLPVSLSTSPSVTPPHRATTATPQQATPRPLEVSQTPNFNPPTLPPAPETPAAKPHAAVATPGQPAPHAPGSWQFTPAGKRPAMLPPPSTPLPQPGVTSANVATPGLPTPRPPGAWQTPFSKAPAPSLPPGTPAPGPYANAATPRAPGAWYTPGIPARSSALRNEIRPDDSLSASSITSTTTSISNIHFSLTGDVSVHRLRSPRRPKTTCQQLRSPASPATSKLSIVTKAASPEESKLREEIRPSDSSPVKVASPTTPVKAGPAKATSPSNGDDSSPFDVSSDQLEGPADADTSWIARLKRAALTPKKPRGEQPRNLSDAQSALDAATKRSADTKSRVLSAQEAWLAALASAKDAPEPPKPTALEPASPPSPRPVAAVATAARQGGRYGLWIALVVVELVLLWAVFRITIDYAQSSHFLGLLDPYKPKLSDYALDSKIPAHLDPFIVQHPKPTNLFDLLDRLGFSLGRKQFAPVRRRMPT